MRNALLRATLPALLLLASGTATALDVADADVAEFIDRTSREHAIDRLWLIDVLGEARHRGSIVEAISRPAERTLEWHEYRDLFVRESRIAGGVRFWREHEAALAAAAERYGVPPAVLVAIVGIETNYGSNQGGYRVLDALSTLSFGYPPRARFFRGELTRFLALAWEGHFDPLEAQGSYAGAMGAPQFMPSSYLAYAVDANDDGRRNLWGDWEDILGSVGNYLAEHGWRAGAPIVARVRLAPDTAPDALPPTRLALDHTIASLREAGVVFDGETPADTTAALFMRLAGDAGEEYWVGLRNFYVITRYNHSVLYAMAVVSLGQAVQARLDRTAR